MLAAPIIALPSSPSLSGSTRSEGRPNIGVSRSLELTPVSCSHKAGPVERMRALLLCAATAQHAEAGFAHCVGRVEPLVVGVEPIQVVEDLQEPARGPYRQSPAATNPAQKKGCPDPVADRRARKVERAAWWTASAVSRPRSKRAW